MLRVDTSHGESDTYSAKSVLSRRVGHGFDCFFEVSVLPRLGVTSDI